MNCVPLLPRCLRSCQTPNSEFSSSSPDNHANFLSKTPYASLMIRPPRKKAPKYYKPIPKSLAYFSGASGSLSITYLPLATLMIGTPGTFLTLLFKSLSFVATRYTLCLTTRSTMQSSAYVPLWSHFKRSNFSSLAICSAMRYFGPSFSNSAMTQSVIIGVQEA